MRLAKFNCRLCRSITEHAVFDEDLPGLLILIECSVCEAKGIESSDKEVK